MKRPIGADLPISLEIPHAMPMSAPERAKRAVQMTRALLDHLEFRGTPMT